MEVAPVLLLVFNRPETTRKVFEIIREVKPKQLFIGADGPRQSKKGEAELCAQARTIVSNVNWPCEVKFLFREQNLGCGRAVSEAITWFFEHVEQGIILEDDCVPDLSFFSYCTQLLNKYKVDEDIFVIGGNNFHPKMKIDRSYYFSAYGHIWGWATWRRAWRHFSFHIGTVPSERLLQGFKYYEFTKKEQEFWISNFKNLDTSQNDIWDFQWVYAQWENKAINIVPAVNLVSNIGFGVDATHTLKHNLLTSRIPVKSLILSDEPVKIKIHRQADVNTFNKIYCPKPSTLSILIKKIVGFLKHSEIKKI